ncbi:MAG: DnaJ domain-containing protein [bacterium]|nr:DnaJ domain-containing protein [bacterium]
MAKKKDYYRTLGIKLDADLKTIKSAYRKLAKEYHPDRHSGSKGNAWEEKFKEVQEAYETLRDAEKRRQYDDQQMLQTAPAYPAFDSLDETFDAFPFEFFDSDWDDDLIAENFSISHFAHTEDLEIVLTATEAKEGGILPIDLPAYFGFGFWTSPYSRHTFTLNIPAGVRDRATQEIYIAELDLWLRVCYRV